MMSIRGQEAVQCPQFRRAGPMIRAQVEVEMVVAGPGEGAAIVISPHVPRLSAVLTVPARAPLDRRGGDKPSG